MSFKRRFNRLFYNLSIRKYLLYKTNGYWSYSKKVNTIQTDNNFDLIFSRLNQKFQFHPNAPVQTHIRCDQPVCGCNYNPFIWVYKPQKALYFENPKVASSSIKRILGCSFDIWDILYYIFLTTSSKKEFTVLLKIHKKDEHKLSHSLQTINKSGQLPSQEKFYYDTKGYVPNVFPFYGKKEEALEKYDSFFKFSFVRSPKERMISNYLMFTQKPFRIQILKTLFNVKPSSLSFHEFIKLAEKYRNHHWEQQTNYLPHKGGKVILDFLGYLENMKDDWKFLADKLDESSLIGKKNVTYRSDKKRTDFFNNKKTEQIFNNMFKDDIEQLKYKE